MRMQVQNQNYNYLVIIMESYIRVYIIKRTKLKLFIDILESVYYKKISFNFQLFEDAKFAKAQKHCLFDFTKLLLM